MSKTWDDLRGVGAYKGIAGRLWEALYGHLYVITGAQPVWDDIQFDFGSAQSPSAEFNWVQVGGSGSIYRPAITGKANEEAQLCLELLHGYKEGTDLYPHIHWMPSSANTGALRFIMSYRLYRLGQIVGEETTINLDVTPPGVAWQCVANEWPAPIPGAGLKIGDQIMVRFTGTRTAFTGNAALLTLGIHIENDSRGSAARFIK